MSRVKIGFLSISVLILVVIYKLEKVGMNAFVYQNQKEIDVVVSVITLVTIVFLFGVLIQKDNNKNNVKEDLKNKDEAYSQIGEYGRVVVEREVVEETLKEVLRNKREVVCFDVNVQFDGGACVIVEMVPDFEEKFAINRFSKELISEIKEAVSYFFDVEIKEVEVKYVMKIKT